MLHAVHGEDILNGCKVQVTAFHVALEEPVLQAAGCRCTDVSASNGVAARGVGRVPTPAGDDRYRAQFVLEFTNSDFAERSIGMLLSLAGVGWMAGVERCG